MSHLSTSYSKLFLCLFATVLLLSFFSFLLFVKPALAVTGINRQINFQGKLVNPDGTNVADNTYSVVFTLYDTSSGGAGLWTETDSVTTSNGIFRVSLGANTAIPSSFNFNWSGLYLGIKVGTDAEMIPRVQMTAVPFAFNAQQVAGLTVQDSSGNASTSGTLQIPNAKTISFGNAFTTNATGALTINAFDASGNTLNLPASGAITLVGTTQTQDLTNKTYNGLTMTSSTLKPTVSGGLAIDANGSNTLSLGANDGNAIVFGKSGTTYTLNGLTGNQSDILALGSSGSLTTIGTTALSQQCLLSSGLATGSPVWGSCGAAGTSGPFTSVGGTIQENNTTQDLLLGGTSTPSAKFAFLNTNTGSGLPTASISGTSNSNALSLDGNGDIQTQNGNTMILGGTTTGDIQFKPGNSSSSLYLASNSKVGIGTTTIGSALQVNGGVAIGYASSTTASANGLQVNGAVGIGGTNAGQTSSTDMLEVHGGIKISDIGIFWNSHALQAQFAFDGNSKDGVIQNDASNGGDTWSLGYVSDPPSTTRGTSVISWNSLGTVGINTTIPLGTLDVRSNSGTFPVASISGKTSFAGLVVDNSGQGDLFTASSSGLSRFTITQSGGIGLGSSNNVGTSSQCLLGGSFASWGACATGGSNSPFQTSGAGSELITQGNLTQDLLLGGTSTASARFAFINTNLDSGTPTASISGTTHSNALSLDGNGNIQTQNGNTLTLGGATTGDIQFKPGNSSSSLYLAASGNIGIGTTQPANIVDIEQNASVLGAADTALQIRNINSGAFARTNFDLGNNSVSNEGRIFVTSSSNTAFGLGGGSLNISGMGGIAFETNNDSNTRAVITNAGLFGIGTTSPRATLGVRGISGTLPIASLSANTTFAGLVVDNSGTGDLFTASSSGLSRFTITQSGGIGLGSANNVGTSTQCLLGGSSASWGACATGGTSSPLQVAGAGSELITEGNLTQDLLLGGIASSSATFHVFGSASAGTSPVASISANTSFAGLVVDNKGTGDLFTASSSGKTRFVIGQNGNVGIGTNPTTSGFNATLQLSTGTQQTPIAINMLGYGGTQSTYINFATNIDAGTGINIGSAGVTSGTDILISGGSNNIGQDFSGNYILANPTRTLSTGSNTRNDSGHFMTLTRADAVSLASTYNLTGDMVDISSNCTVTNGGVCTDSSHLLSLTQNLASASASVFNITNNGAGIGLNLNGNVGTNPAASISGQTSFAGLVVDNSGKGDLFTASSSGLSRFTITQSGGIGLGSANNVGTSSQCLLGGSSASWGACATGGSSSPFQTAGTGNELITEGNITQDLLLGGTSTASAKFAFINTIGSGTPTASIAGTSNNALSLDGNGNIQTQKGNTLTLGGTTTGDIQFKPGNSSSSLYLASSGKVGIGTTSPANLLHIANNGNAIAEIQSTDTASTAQLTIVSNTGATLALNNRGATSGGNTFGISNNDMSSITSDHTLAIGTAGNPLPLVFGTNGSERMRIDATGNVGIGTSSPLATLDVRGKSGTTPIASVSAKTSFAGLVVDNSGTGDLFTASSSGLPRFTITQSGGIGLGSANNVGTSSQCLLGGSSASWGACATGGSSSPFQVAGTGSELITEGNLTQDLLLGGIASSSATFHVFGSASAGTSPVASISANTAFAGLVVDNKGTGDLFTASSSGLTRFVITQNGNVGIGTATPSNELTIQGQAKSVGSTGTQMITAVADQQFTAGNTWTTSGTPLWSINVASSGVAAKDAPGTGALQLPNGSLNASLVNGQYYQVQFTFTTTASSSGSLTPSMGGVNASSVGQDVSMSLTTAYVFKASNTNQLTFTPTSSWYGTIDNVTVTPLTASTAVATLLNSDGTVGTEFRSGGSSLNNTFSGYQAGLFDKDGNKNTATGYQAFLSNTSGNNNTATGYQALFSNTSGNNNTATGYQALNVNTTGSNNTATGDQALVNNTTGISNSAIGFAALLSNTTGSFNSANGAGAFFFNTTGSQNTANGFEALFDNTSGSSNTALGYLAGNSVATGSNNLFLGTNAGYNLSGASSGNVLLGYNAGPTSIGTVNNKLYLANSWTTTPLIGGDFANNLAGINTATPTATFDVRQLLAGSTTAGTLPVASISGKTSFAGLVVDNAGKGDLFTASSSGMTRFTIKSNGGLTLPTDSSSVAEGVTFGTTTPMSIYRSAAGKLTIGDGTNGLTVDTNSSGTAITYTGNSRPTKTITLSPEYAGAVLTQFYGAGTDATPASGSNMISDADTTTGTSIRTYYEWKATNASQQFYTVAVRVTLPKDFSAWTTSNAVVVNYITQSATSTNSSLDVRVYNDNSSSVVASTTGLTSTSWTTTAFGSSSLTGWATAGQSAVIYLRMGSASSNYVHIGDIQLNYLASF